MKKKGFTLIELLVIIAILGLVALIAVPTILTVIQNSRKNSYDEQERVIVSSARTYMSANSNLLPEQTAGASICITIKKLQEEGILKNTDIINPLYGKGSLNGKVEKDKYFNGGVEITYKDGKYVYEYVDSDDNCNTIDGGSNTPLTPSNKIGDMTKATIAMVSTSGIYKNSDGIPQPGVLQVYEIYGFDDLSYGFNIASEYGNTAIDSVAPLYGLRIAEKEGIIGKVHDRLFTFLGNGASSNTITNETAPAIVNALKSTGTDGVIITAFGSECIASAKIVKSQLEAEGLSVVIITENFGPAGGGNENKVKTLINNWNG